MVDHQINSSICNVLCNKESGTGWLIDETTIITARHCVVGAIEVGASIELTFSERAAPLRLPAQIMAYDDELDVCLLSISESIGTPPILFVGDLPREGAQWRSFGYPAQKTEIGHRISGVVEHVLLSPAIRIDLDLSVNHANALSAYRGLSGAPVVVDGACVGMLRLKVDRSLGAISMRSMLEFLAKWGFTPSGQESEASRQSPSSSLAERTEFQEAFETRIEQAQGAYLFLEGAHGIGKTTFCAEFRPIESKILSLGSYQLSAKTRGANPVIRSQPEVFYEWLLTAVSTLLTERTARKEELSYPKMAEASEWLLKSFSEYCKQHTQHGVLFIDGINEGASADAVALRKLLGMLPSSLPENVTIVLTAPNYHTVADVVSLHVEQKDIVTLPLLSEQSCHRYCQQQLPSRLLNATLLDQIWNKSQGHPLYLRYLIEFLGADEGQSLDEFPTLAGSIEEYYESVWTKLLQDTDAVNLLAVIARLRWGILSKDLLPLMSPGERAAFIPTIVRIRHLLDDKDSTEIYHASFAEFVCKKTIGLESIVHQRLADWCNDASELEYCKLNVIFHYLRAGDSSARKAVSLCQQVWVDECVRFGVEPDVLMTDVEKTLSIALRSALGTEVLRLLLLQQRINFRYNVLFTQSAHLIAHALIALKRPGEALKFAVRFDTLIVAPSDALHIAYRLIDGGHDVEALEILQRLYKKVAESYFDSKSKSIHEFIELGRLLIQINMYAGAADGNLRPASMAHVLRRSHEILTLSLPSSPSGHLQSAIARVQSMLAGLSIYLHGTYSTIHQLKQKIGNGELPPAYVLTLFGGLIEYSELADDLGPRTEKPKFDSLFADIDALMADENTLDEHLPPAALDALIEFHAPLELVQVFKTRLKTLAPKEINFIDENGVDAAYDNIRQGLSDWRAKYFLEDEIACPSIESIKPWSWKRSFEQILRATAWFEARSRRAIVDVNIEASRETFDVFSTRILPYLHFELEQRTKWDDSYALPEAVFPLIWQRVTVVFRDAYATELPKLLEDLTDRCTKQLGLYTEGYRKCMLNIVSTLIHVKDNDSLQDSLFALLNKWKEHVIACVENRHELVPELLTLIPLFVKMGAHEQADELYRHVLNVSMGPTWYKEDQFTLMTTALRKMPTTDPLDGALSTIAGYLHRASGEMTFQRYIRYEKAEFLGELIRRNAYSQGVRYFIRQTCGTYTELLEDQQVGEVDRINPAMGMRFPGTALDEQDAVLRIVRNAVSVKWRLRWALLEIFQCGDRRHLREYAFEYARFISSAPDHEVDEMFLLLDAMIGAEISTSDREEFLRYLTAELNDKFVEKLELLNAKYTEKNAPPSLSEFHQTRNTVDHPSEKSDDLDEKLYMPGTFGTQASTRAALSQMSSSERNYKRGNVESAKNEAIQTLKALQDGGWSIWNNISGSTALAAENLISDNEADANAAIQRYSTLIEDEQYDTKWSMASHLIERVGHKFSISDRQLVLKHVLEHVQLMVGDSVAEMKEFTFLDSDQSAVPDDVFFDLILWLTDHPNFIRRMNAARLLLRIVDYESSHINKVVQTAISNSVSYAGDVTCGVLDGLSARDPIRIWERIVGAIDIKTVPVECRHVGRLAVFARIAKRAATKGSQSASEVVALINEQLRTGVLELSGINENYPVPQWANCIEQEWHQLKAQGLVTRELIIQMEAQLREICHPLSIFEAMSLENEVSQAFREASQRPLNRWEGKVRSALARAVLPYASQRNLQALEAAIRPYNPNTPERTMVSGLKTKGHAMVQAFKAGKDFREIIGNSDSFYLNYYETLLVLGENPTETRASMIEVFAILLPHPSLAETAIAAAMDSICDSLSYPDLSNASESGPTCLRLKPSFAFFGSFTPAFPITSFLEKVGCTFSDLTRTSWRNGRSHTMNHNGTPESEGSFLAVRRSALHIPTGMKLVWAVKLDGKYAALVDENNKRLR